MKTNGATWKQYLDSWPKGQWFDDSDETIDGVDGSDFEGEIPDDATVEFTCGVVFPKEVSREGVDLVGHFRRWLKAQTHVVLVVDIPKEEQQALTAFLHTIKGKYCN